MLGINPIHQICFIVPDLHAAMRQWQKSERCGPFFIMEKVQPENPVYRGNPTFLEMTVGFAQAGDLQIELIQPLSAEPSAYTDSVERGTTGFHHVCYWVDDYVAERQRYHSLGVATAFEASFGTMRFAYYDTRELIGCMTETLESDAVVKALFDKVRTAAIGWDGRDPVRPLVE